MFRIMASLCYSQVYCIVTNSIEGNKIILTLYATFEFFFYKILRIIAILCYSLIERNVTNIIAAIKIITTLQCK